LDFGIAKVVGSDEGATKTGVLKGKLRYMAPEQVSGGDLDRRADLFSVGVMLWEAIAGQRLWGDATDGQVVRSLVEGKIPPLPRDDVDPRLVAVCERALAVDPSDRYPTAGEFRRELQACLEARTGELLDEALSQFLARHFAERRDAMRARVAERIQRETSRPPPAIDPASSAAPRTRSLLPGLATSGRLAAIGALVVATLGAFGLLLAMPSVPEAGSGAMLATARDPAAPALGAAPCAAGFKSCDGRCVSSDRPEHGCAAQSCSPCLRANATPRCDRDGLCSVAVCYRGYDDCDGNSDNGCETFLRTDPLHCGACSVACQSLPHAQVGCGDTCRIWRCEPGHEDCNGATEDGCEVDLRGDPHHCGACGASCPAHQRCREGRCTP
ncbi:MAG TPA: protein kinase, partial [Polyangiaceae bacterium]|nr:protein kinase [Polyangiaceae bacterium]